MVIPALDEAIPAVLAEIDRAIAQDIVVVDNGSILWTIVRARCGG